ncbi:MAG: DNA alkylation repair protein [Methanosarcina sp.]
MNDILKELRQDLLKNSNEKDRIAGERFFKEDVKILGMKSSVVSVISEKHYAAITGKSRLRIFALCEDLFSTGIMEEGFVACNWSYKVNSQYEPSDFRIFEGWVKRYVNNWAVCDTLCNHTVGTLVEMYPELTASLKEWATSENRWVKRASAVTLIVPAKKGKFLDEVFEIADTLLTDRDDMVQKGYGWMLKVASQAHLDEVYDYVMKNRNKMPRTALRYAIEKMPHEMKREAMRKL